MLSLPVEFRLDLRGGCEQASKKGEGKFIHIRVTKLWMHQIYCVNNLVW